MNRNCYSDQIKNRIYHIRYQKSNNKDRYLRQHETKLLLHDGAENMLKRFDIDTRNLDVEKLRSDYHALHSKKKTLRKTCQSAEKDITALTRNQYNLNLYLDCHPAQQENADRKLDKNQQPL